MNLKKNKNRNLKAPSPEIPQKVRAWPSSKRNNKYKKIDAQKTNHPKDSSFQSEQLHSHREKYFEAEIGEMDLAWLTNLETKANLRSQSKMRFWELGKALNFVWAIRNKKMKFFMISMN